MTSGFNRLQMKAKVLILIIILIFSTLYCNNNLSLSKQNSSNLTIRIPNLQNDVPFTSSNENYPFTIVTGASENHFCPLQSWIYYLNNEVSFPESKKPRIIVYDLGLHQYQKNIINQLKSKGFITQLKTFNYSSYPDFFKIDSKHNGQYAWKPAIVYEMSQEYPDTILFWLDTGSLVTTSFLEKFHHVLDLYDGLFCPESSGTMKQWTHPGVYKYFNDKEELYADDHNCNAASILFDIKRSQRIINQWYQCALVEDCIAPPGSSRKNHRQDQSLLTYLMLKDGRKCAIGNRWGIMTHKDNVCTSEILSYGQVWTPSEEDLKEIEELKKLHPTKVFDVRTHSFKPKEEKEKSKSKHKKIVGTKP